MQAQAVSVASAGQPAQSFTVRAEKGSAADFEALRAAYSQQFVFDAADRATRSAFWFESDNHHLGVTRLAAIRAAPGPTNAAPAIAAAVSPTRSASGCSCRDGRPASPTAARRKSTPATSP